MVLKELDLHYTLLIQCEKINEIYEEQALIYDETINRLENLNSQSEQQIEILKKQLKKRSSSWIVPTLSGIAIGVLTGAILN